MASRASGRLARALLALAAIGLFSLPGRARGIQPKPAPAPPAASGPTLAGTLRPTRTEVVRAAVGASVSRVAVVRGQSVRRGQLLVRLFAPEYEDLAASARGSLEKAERLARRADRTRAEAEALAAKGALSPLELDDARALAASTRQALERARSRVVTAEAGIGQLSIRAPFAGVVSELNAQSGDDISPGVALATVIDDGTMLLDAPVAPEDLAKLRAGQALTVSVAGFARPFAGTIERIFPTVDPVTGEVTVQAAIPNPNHRLIPGLSAEARIRASRGGAPPLSHRPSPGVSMRSGWDRSALRLTSGRWTREQRDVL